ncbi:MAG TPA: aldo/keto reductase, partial [Thermomicrobiales bacterium]|nr:aldo/keto reductase [Thermomicrobiales bacterium]
NDGCMSPNQAVQFVIGASTPMEYATLDRIPAKFSRIVQGTVMISDEDQTAADALLDAVWENGGRTFDTAHGYGRGACERALGSWLSRRGIRDEAVIIGKGAHPYDGRNRVTPENITSDLHESLERMGIETIDLYLLHRDDPTIPVGPIVDVLNEHLRAGKIRRFGGSNWTTIRIAAANAYAAESGLKPFTASSPNFSLAQQRKAPWAGCISVSGEAGAAEREWYITHDMPVFPWSSLAGGFFSGRFTRTNLHTFRETLDLLAVEAYAFEDNFRRLDRVQEAAEWHEASVAQIALAWVLHQPMRTFPLVGSRTGEEFAANAAALDLVLTPEEIEWLDLQRDERPW